MLRCDMCGGRASEEDKCYGCGCYICEICDEEIGILGLHDLQDHSKKAQEKDRAKKLRRLENG